MIKRTIGSIFLLLSISAQAQQSAASAYSFYGLGEQKFKGTAENRAMGGVSVFTDSIHINLNNPASYAGLKRTTFTIGASYNTVNFETNQATGKARRTSVDYMALGFPVTKKFGIGFGLLPYTSVGYQLNTLTQNAGELSTMNTGEGGLNKAYLSAGYQITKDLAVGATFNYNFGQIETSSIAMVNDTQYGTKELNGTDMSGVNFSIGAMWNKKITSKHTFFASANFTPATTIHLDNTRNISIFEYNQNGGQTTIDEQDVQTPRNAVKSAGLLNFGVGYGENRKWLVGAEYTTINNSDFGNRFADIKNATFDNGNKLSVGGYYIPKYNSFTSYFERITYRAGFKMENNGMVMHNLQTGFSKEIKDMSVSLGLTLPVSGTFSRINVGLEYGKRGTTDGNFVQENYTNVFVSLSFSDLWFVKRKYN